MITADNDLIEQIVANVLAELQPAPAVRAQVSIPPESSPAKLDASMIELDLPVITADSLAERLRAGQSVRIGRRSILTPSARDWLASRKISWSRLASGAAAGSKTSARWQLVLTAVTPALATLRPSLSEWKTELLGTAREAADHAIRVISTSESDGVLGLCTSPEAVACLANRNPKLRAAVLNSPAEVPGLVDQLSPNFLVINPRGKSFVELRNLVRVVETLAKPRDCDPWASGT